VSESALTRPPILTSWLCDPPRLRGNLAGEMDRGCADHAPIIVKRTASASVAMISLEAGRGTERAPTKTDLAE
jgi:hypothetical protein